MNHESERNSIDKVFSQYSDRSYMLLELISKQLDEIGTLLEKPDVYFDNAGNCWMVTTKNAAPENTSVSLLMKSKSKKSRNKKSL